jgi:chromosome segregation ATPase
MSDAMTMTPERLKHIRAELRSSPVTMIREIALTLCDALEAAWRERDEAREQSKHDRMSREAEVAGLSDACERLTAERDTARLHGQTRLESLEAICRVLDYGPGYEGLASHIEQLTAERDALKARNENQSKHIRAMWGRNKLRRERYLLQLNEWRARADNQAGNFDEVKERRAEVARLTAERDALKTTLESVAGEEHRAKKELRANERTEAALRQAIATHVDEKDRLRARAETAEVELVVRDALLFKVRERALAAEKRVEELEGECLRWHGCHAALKLDYSEMKARAEAAEAEVERLKTDNAEMLDLLEGTVRPEFAESASEMTMAPRIRAFLDRCEVKP